MPPVKRGLRIAIDHEYFRAAGEWSLYARVMTVDAALFDRAWKRNRDCYIDPGAPGEAARKYKRFESFFFAKTLLGTPFIPADCYLQESNGDPLINFVNGRHRTAWLRDHGIARLPVAVPPDQIARWKKMFAGKVLPFGQDLWWTHRS